MVDEKKASLKAVFQSLDEDKSGEVSIEELVAFVRAADPDSLRKGDGTRRSMRRSQASLYGNEREEEELVSLDPKPQDLVVDLEFQDYENPWHTRYASNRYPRVAQDVKDALEKQLKELQIPHVVRLNPGPPESLGKDPDTKFVSYYGLPGW